ncbi:MAG: single-stranded DNA-binding protein [candidate division Zixibacteria bacterium]|nr:single-stranded DNA-binding protein [Candidatus Tariuqbacter arcticus]
MASLNKVILIGNLGQDPELKYTPSGVAVCTFSIATKRTWNDQDGNRQEKTDWHNIKIWRKQAEIAAEYLKKGKQVCIEGRLETHSWEQDGQKKYMTEIIAQNFQMLGKKDDSGGGSERPQSSETPPSEPEEGSTKEDDDLPF